MGYFFSETNFVKKWKPLCNSFVKKLKVWHMKQGICQVMEWSISDFHPSVIDKHNFFNYQLLQNKSQTDHTNEVYSWCSCPSVWKLRSPSLWNFMHFFIAFGNCVMSWFIQLHAGCCLHNSSLENEIWIQCIYS